MNLRWHGYRLCRKWIYALPVFFTIFFFQLNGTEELRNIINNAESATTIFPHWRQRETNSTTSHEWHQQRRHIYTRMQVVHMLILFRASAQKEIRVYVCVGCTVEGKALAKIKKKTAAGYLKLHNIGSGWIVPIVRQHGSIIGAYIYHISRLTFRHNLKKKEK